MPVTAYCSKCGKQIAYYGDVINYDGNAEGICNTCKYKKKVYVCHQGDNYYIHDNETGDLLEQGDIFKLIKKAHKDKYVFKEK